MQHSIKLLIMWTRLNNLQSVAGNVSKGLKQFATDVLQEIDEPEEGDDEQLDHKQVNTSLLEHEQDVVRLEELQKDLTGRSGCTVFR